jgi:acyl-coenzyme A synthetase/AMP-(fatty) acid ligase
LFARQFIDRERAQRKLASREHPGCYSTGDGYLDEGGYVFVMGHIDDVINVGGHRRSTCELAALELICQVLSRPVSR